MPGIEPVTLEAGDFTLRPGLPGDVEPALAMLRDPDVRQWNPGPDVLTEESVRDWLLRGADWSSGTFAVWMVVDRDGLVGNAFLVGIDFDQRDAWVAYRTAPWARGRGVATAATIAMTSYAFNTLGLERLSLGHAIANPASCRIATKAGYTYEGTRTAAYRDPQGVRWDDHIHGRVKEGVAVRSG